MEQDDLSSSNHSLDSLLGPSVTPKQAVSAPTSRVNSRARLDALESIGNLLSLVHEQGRTDEAIALLRRSLKQQRRELGDRHERTLSTMNNMALLLDEIGRSDEAEPLIREAQEGHKHTLGKDHPETLNCIHNAAIVLMSTGHQDEAAVFFREALEAQTRVLGKEHPDTLNTVNGLAVLLAELGQNNEAEKLCRQALYGRRKVLGDDHEDYIKSKELLEMIRGPTGPPNLAGRSARRSTLSRTFSSSANLSELTDFDIGPDDAGETPQTPPSLLDLPAFPPDFISETDLLAMTLAGGKSMHTSAKHRGKASEEKKECLLM